MKKELNLKKIFILITFFAILIRIVWINGKSGDYLGFLEPWIKTISRFGGVKSLKYNIGDYNVPYVVILTIISYFKNHLYLIKFVSIVFDFVCAIFGYKIVYKVTNNKLQSLVAYGVILFLPTVIVNGAMWGQCDSIYTSFILMSIYYLLDKKYIKSFILLGVSFSLKLQFMFILPLYIIMFFREKDIKWYYFLLIPLVNVIMCLPAIIAGRNIVDVLSIYFNQTSTYKDLVLNYPNIYNIIQSNVYFSFTNLEIIALVGVIYTIFIYFIMWLFVLVTKVNFNSEKILSLAIWSLIIATYFLPRMHDRYMFVGDILSIVWFIIYQKKFYVPLVINLCSIISYFQFLFGYEFLLNYYNIIAIIYFVMILIYTKYLMNLLSD